MDKLVEKYNLSKLNQEEIENLNRPITSMDIETVIKNLPTTKSPGTDGFTGEFYLNFREERTPILNSARKLQRKANSQVHSEECSFYACFLESFLIINRCLILSKSFSASVEIIIWFLIIQFLNMMYHID